MKDGRMGFRKSRSVTLIVALATLTSNTLSSLLFAQLPDDPYHLASNFGWYLHFANVLSVFGFIGALRQHALSVAIFANYLILDTILCSIPRFLLLTLLQPLSSTLCSDTASSPSSSFFYPEQQTPSPQIQPSSPGFDSVASEQWTWSEYTSTWTEDGCLRIMWLAQITLAAGVVAATLLQFVGALCVREYARSLWLREVREEESRVLGSVERRGFLPVIEEESERMAGEDEKMF